MAGSLSLNISLKVPNPTDVSVHVAGSLNQNYTWQDHSVGITRGGITQSEYFPKGPQSHRGLGSRGGITQSELHVAGSLSLNISLKVPNPTGVSVHVAGSLACIYVIDWGGLPHFCSAHSRAVHFCH